MPFYKLVGYAIGIGWVLEHGIKNSTIIPTKIRAGYNYLVTVVGVNR